MDSHYPPPKLHSKLTQIAVCESAAQGSHNTIKPNAEK